MTGCATTVGQLGLAIWPAVVVLPTIFYIFICRQNKSQIISCYLAGSQQLQKCSLTMHLKPAKWELLIGQLSVCFPSFGGMQQPEKID